MPTRKKINKSKSNFELFEKQLKDHMKFMESIQPICTELTKFRRADSKISYLEQLLEQETESQKKEFIQDTIAFHYILQTKYKPEKYDDVVEMYERLHKKRKAASVAVHAYKDFNEREKKISCQLQTGDYSRYETRRSFYGCGYEDVDRVYRGQDYAAMKNDRDRCKLLRELSKQKREKALELLGLNITKQYSDEANRKLKKVENVFKFDRIKKILQTTTTHYEDHKLFYF